MECNREEALRAMKLAEGKMGVGDFIGAEKLVKKAQQLFPSLENLSQLVTICDVHCSAQNKISGLDNWYGILKVNHFADEAAIKKQYRKLALLLHPDKNKFAGAEAAFKLIGEAHRLLSDQSRRSQYDIKYKIYSRVSASKLGNRQSNLNSVRQNVPSYDAANSGGNRNPVNIAFWTCCEHCGSRYKYLREYVNTVMHCCRCRRAYVAVDTGPYGVSPISTPSQFSSQQDLGPGNTPLQNNTAEPVRVRPENIRMNTNVMREEELNKNERGDQKNDTETRKPEAEKGSAEDDAKASKAEENKGSTMSGAELPKADAVKPQSELRGHEGGAGKPTPDVTEPKVDEGATVKNKDKRRRKAVEESSKGSEIDGCDNAGPKKAVNGDDKRRSSRRKRKFYYAEDGSDDDFVSPPAKSPKSDTEFKSDGDTKEAALGSGLFGDVDSDAFPAAAETHKEKVEKKADSVSEDIFSNKDKPSENCEANVEGASPSAKADEIDEVSEANKEIPKSEEYPDPDFNTFVKRKGDFSAKQVWALYDPLDGMPRFCAHIIKVSTNPFKLQMTWLEPLRVTQTPKNETDIPVACGKFKFGERKETGDLLMFSHQMHCRKRGSYYTIYPQQGETWALFRDWDISWTTDPGKYKPPYKYDFVEVVSDFQEKADGKGVSGIGVYYLEKVKGFVSLFVRATLRKVLACTFSPCEMGRFSHRVPSFRMTGTEGEGVPAGSFELDPVALPKDVLELDPCKVNARMDMQNLDGKADGACPKAPGVEVKSAVGPESVCSPKKRQKTERKNGSIAKVSNGISSDQDKKIHSNVSLCVEVEDLTSRGHASSSSCPVDEMNTKTCEKSKQTVDASRLRRSTRVLSEKGCQTNSSQQKAEKKTCKDGEFSAPSDRCGLFGDNMNSLNRPKKDQMTDSLKVRRSPRDITKTTVARLQGNQKKHESNSEPFSWSMEYVDPTDSRCSKPETCVLSDRRMGHENAFNFKEGRSENKFQDGQIWALYSGDKKMPTEYGLIRKIETTPGFKLLVTYLEPCSPSENETRPVCCGLFKKKAGKPKSLLRSSFSHQVSAQRVNRSSFEIYPGKGEVWALYKSNNTASSAGTDEYDIVEVAENNGQVIKAMMLTSTGSRTRYIAAGQGRGSSKTAVTDIPKEEVAKFSHQIPAFRQQTRRDQLGCEWWELDPAALPVLTIVID